MEINKQLMHEFSLRPDQVNGAIELIDAGNTIPFIARYRKEATGGLSDQVLRELHERLAYLRGLDKRRGEIRDALAGQGALTDALAAQLAGAVSLAELEDIYRPYRPKRRTRATIARERGLEGLAQAILAQSLSAEGLATQARAYVSAEREVPDEQAALAGARDIIAEVISDDAPLRGRLRALAWRGAILTSAKAKDEESVYEMYYAHQEGVRAMPGHRVLAIDRGEREAYLKVAIIFPEEAPHLAQSAFVRGHGASSEQVALAAADAWRRLIAPSLERELRSDLSERAGAAAVRLFADNVRQLLMTPPIKGQVVLGVDPGFRTGCKLAVVDAQGKVLAVGVGHFTIPGQTAQREQAQRQIMALIERHGVSAIAIGNGTASREAEQFIAQLIRPYEGRVRYAIVNEAGASVYSASKLAAEEFPQYDVSLRSAVSIARRMQDPLAELVKIDPKSIGVGQYQHDLKDAHLSEALRGAVEACVNHVGVELSTASASLLTYVAGIGPALAASIVAYREEHGIATRAQLKKVPKLGPRAFEQCAGFLRIAQSANPLDATAVHPESYAAAKALLAALGCAQADIRAGGLQDIEARVRALGTDALAQQIGVGVPTLTDIVRELQKPGRDPRDELPPTLLKTDVLSLDDLAPGMELMGTVRNVIDFGAFVDIGVHQDGLVHISQMADRFIRHPSEVARVGEVVKVWVLEVDARRKRIALSMKAPR